LARKRVAEAVGRYGCWAVLNDVSGVAGFVYHGGNVGVLTSRVARDMATVGVIEVEFNALLEGY
jgi:hypothetical protein